MSTHLHDFSDSEWPFQEPVNAAAFTTTKVVREGFPVLRVTHDEEGDWQILCGTTNRSEDCLIVCLGCAFQRNRAIGEVADLPWGWLAWRDSADSPWQREEKEPEEAEDE